jgi:hypothetical protein
LRKGGRGRRNGSGRKKTDMNVKEDRIKEERHKKGREKELINND